MEGRLTENDKSMIKGIINETLGFATDIDEDVINSISDEILERIRQYEAMSAEGA